MKLKYLLVLVMSLPLWGCGSSTTAPARLGDTGAVAPATAVHLRPAIVKPSLVYRAIEVQQQLDSREGEPYTAGEPWFEVVSGRIPVVITAPHATRPLRDGKRRFSDGGGTAALALALAELTGAHVIYTTEEGPSDPNYVDENAFKSELARLVRELQPRLVLDIHGSHAFRPYDIDLGTMHGASLLGQEFLQQGLVTSLYQEGILNISGNYFAAGKNQTITKFVADHGVPAIQVEVNSTYLSPSAGNIEAQRFSRLVQAMARFIETAWGRPQG